MSELTKFEWALFWLLIACILFVVGVFEMVT